MSMSILFANLVTYSKSYDKGYYYSSGILPCGKIVITNCEIDFILMSRLYFYSYFFVSYH